VIDILAKMAINCDLCIICQQQNAAPLDYPTPIGYIVSNNGRLTSDQKLLETSLIAWNQNKTGYAKKRWAVRVRCVSPGEREDLWWEGFVKEVGFELGVKKCKSYGWCEWWIYGKSWTDMRRKIRA